MFRGMEITTKLFGYLSEGMEFLFKGMEFTTDLFRVLFQGIETYTFDGRFVFCDAPKHVAISYAEGNYIPTPLNEQIPFDPVVVEMMIGIDYSEMSQEDIYYRIKHVCPWYEGNHRESLKDGVNTTSDLDRAIDCAGDDGYVLVLWLRSNNFCDFGNSFIYVKSVKDIHLISIYEVSTGKEYTPSEFLRKVN